MSTYNTSIRGAATEKRTAHNSQAGKQGLGHMQNERKRHQKIKATLKMKLCAGYVEAQGI